MADNCLNLEPVSKNGSFSCKVERLLVIAAKESGFGS